jgi:outer membrane protein assembly factor BamB
MLITATIAVMLAASVQGAGQVGGFSFAHITDTHCSGAANEAALKRWVASLPNLSPRLTFVVNTGDIAELGTPAEFARYRAAIAGAAAPIQSVPGNHDVRWAPLGKEGFTQGVGPAYRSFDQGGCHFVLLDSTIVLEHWGHFDGAQLAWLEGDLKKLKRGTPVFVFFHHWVGRDNSNIDNGGDLLRILAPHNVAAIFMGHGHKDWHWTTAGIDCFMALGLYQGSWHRIDVSTETAKVVLVKEAGEQTVAEIRLRKPARLALRLTWDDPEASNLARRRFIAVVTGADGKAVTEGLRGEFSIDGGAPQPGQVDAGAKRPRGLTGEFETETLQPGSHALGVTVTMPDGALASAGIPFVYEPTDARPNLAWAFKTADTIQGSPTLVEERLLCPSFDGKLYCLKAATGAKAWALATGGALFSSAAVADDRVYVGSMDHKLYAADLKSGSMLWATDIGSPLFATPAVCSGVVCIGADKAVVGLDAASGKQLWRVAAGSFFQSRAATDGAAFYLGGWDNTLYAIEAATGAVRWKARMGRTKTGAISTYYSPAIASPTCGGGRVYAVTNDGLLHCLDAATGAEAWAVRAPKGGDGFGYSSPLLHEGRLYLGGLGDAGRGDCYCLDAATGDRVWRCSTGADNYDSSPAAVGPWIAIGSVQHRLTWIDARTGKACGTYAVGAGYSFTTPCGSADLTFTAGMSGIVTALRTPTAPTL